MSVPSAPLIHKLSSGDATLLFLSAAVLRRPHTASSRRQRPLVSVLRVRRVLVALGRVVGGQRGSVDAGVVEGAAGLVTAAALHHEVTTHWPAGHVCEAGGGVNINISRYHHHHHLHHDAYRSCCCVLLGALLALGP